MKAIAKYCLQALASFMSIIFPYKRMESFAKIKRNLYWRYILHFIKGADKSVKINPGLDLYGGGMMKIGANTMIQDHARLNCWSHYGNQEFNPSLTIGKNCRLGEYIHISCINKITIGDNLLTGRYCLITDNSHGKLSKTDAILPPEERQLVSKGEIVIGNNVWIGERVTICAGVHIGDGVIIAANAVVTHDIPNNCMAAGVPAKVIKMLN